MNDNSPDIGHAYFYDAVPPPLKVGTYNMSVDQTISPAISKTKIDQPFQRKFEIVGPRYRLLPTDIHSLYPPPNATGPFIGRLPQIVLTRRTLPWEREVVPFAKYYSPWIAVLLLKEDEIEGRGQTTAQAIYDHNAGISGWVTPSHTTEEGKTKCLQIEIPIKIFKRIAPMKQELKYLAHGRQVNTEDKELLGLDEDGWFGVVVGNRLPQASTKYVACLVSLEGLADVLLSRQRATDDFTNMANEVSFDGLNDTLVAARSIIKEVPSLGIASVPNPFGNVATEKERDFAIERYTGESSVTTPPEPTIQLITLAQWQFETDDSPGTFEDLMEDLPHQGGVALLGDNQNNATLDGVENDTAYQVALDSGHVPLKHITREGKTTLSWYRGPLVPIGMTHDKSAGPYHTSDQARRIDQLTGLENLGYASAFELGRLMGLADARFAVELLRWRRGDHLKIAGLIQVKLSQVIMPDIADVIKELIRAEHIVYSGLLGKIVDDIYIQTGINTLIQPAELTGFGGVNSKLPGLNPDADLVLADGSLIRVSQMIEVNSVLDSAGVFVASPIPIESDFDTLRDTASAEFNHLNKAFNSKFENR